MKKVLDFIYSSKMTVVLLLVLAVAMGTATFIEDKYDTETARIWVYGAKWFESLFVLLVLNFIGNIVKYNMLSRKKFTGFLFHSAFIVIIIGAGITRYFGFTGTMHIRQGEVSSTFFSADPYLRVAMNDSNTKEGYEMPLHIGQNTDNSFHFTVSSKQKGSFDIAYKDYFKNAIDTIIENVDGGVSMLCLVVPGENGRQTIYLKEGEIRDFGPFVIAYNNNARKDAINITHRDGDYYINSPLEIARTAMPAMINDTIFKDKETVFKQRCLYNTGNGVFVFKQAYTKAIKDIVPGKGKAAPMMNESYECLVLNIKHNNKSQDYKIIGGVGYVASFQDVNVDGTNIKIGFGAKELQLPFAISLDQFVLERYAGSQSPSSFMSKVTLVDEKKSVKMPYDIYMNHVLDYGGYRFFQTSYDQDEKGTILSVNHDALGAWVSYLGYFLMGLGFLLTLFNRTSRFYILSQLIRKLRQSRLTQVSIMLALLLIPQAMRAQTGTVSHVSKEQADKFGHLVTQTFEGRFEPVNTLAWDAIHKISKKDELDVPGYGKMLPMQAFMDMFLNSEFWKNQKVIAVREKSVQDILGITGGMASFQDFFDASGNYKLRAFAETSFRKGGSERNTFDKEIIKVDERANVCMMIFQGSMLKIFPLQGSSNNTWTAWDDSLAELPLGGDLKILNEDLQLARFDYKNIMGLYMQEVFKGTKYNNYDRANKILDYISSIQRQSPAVSQMPSPNKIALEIQYNESRLFSYWLLWLYMVVSLVLLGLSFIDILSPKMRFLVKIFMYPFIGFLAIGFLLHTYGLVIRWYITGHAPWSTGYEALLLIGWGGILAGFFYIRNSKITMAATSLLAFFVTMTAVISDYDPQLTNLQPVLKSYWLVIHVACLTISYGFLGLGAILGLINLFIYLVKNKKNMQRLDLVTSELTHINEMNLTIGLFLATVGTFLGGVWANESWGKYWGWDAKETWALVIVVTYTIILHMRFVNELRREFIFNVASVLGYGSVLMTFFGVNYYLSKGLHSYAAGETQVFPTWAWITIISILLLMVAAGLKGRSLKR